MPDKKVTTGTTSTQDNNIIHQKITRIKELTLLFWVNEKDDSRCSLFEESCMTRYFNILYSPEYKKETHKVYPVSISRFDQIKKIIANRIDQNGGIDKAKVKEIGIFSHVGKVDGPTTQYTVNTPAVNGYPQQLNIVRGWDDINFNWTDTGAMFVMYGCRSSFQDKDSGDGFASKLSKLANFRNVDIWGQTEYTYPSYYPDIRETSLIRTFNIGWSFSPTYMVADKEDNGWDALFPDEKKPIKALPMQCFKNGALVKSVDQSIFNDHRKNKPND
ncbi:hypothetical protein CHU32_01425 [Superficieibacter electus]|uniref:Uncharacterized protein n=1 Tax=Superficieibacter electus TaxID=2022662 RepID=A0A2P5GWA1_9ENTR|nr:hypothetical protein [Superficieibacter electus]POP47827.1 hypothetical protein CHU33_01420 [Superficieibacter electus]POP50840.1 hypothetical protein CHU32_01425 [Superficieibacter electus]